MFAFMHLTWVHIVGGLIALSILGRVAGRRPDGSSRRRGWFPWKIAILVVLAVVTIRHFAGPHHEVVPAEQTATIADAVPPAHPHVRGGPFPAVKKRDLWAMRKARQKAARSESNQSDETELAESAAATGAITSADQSDDGPRESTDTTETAADVRSDVARTVAEAKAIAHRAAAEAREIYASTRRDVALAVFGARQAKDSVSDQPDVAGQPVAASASADEVASLPSTTTAIPADAEPSPVPTSAPAPPAAPDAYTAPAAPPVAGAPAIVPAAPSAAADTQRPAPPPAPVAEKARPVTVAPPAWLKEPPGLSGDVYYTTVSVGPWKSVAECDEELIPKVKEAVSRYLENYLGEGASKTVNVSLPYIHDRIIRDRYVQNFESETPSVNAMVNLHVRLAFDGRTRAQLKRMYREAQVESRLLEVAGGVAAVLLVLGAVFGYLKLDTMTRGFYTRRLQFASAVLILAVAGVAALLFFVAAPRVVVQPQTYGAPAATVPVEMGIKLTESPTS